jgi:hypothetical protein
MHGQGSFEFGEAFAGGVSFMEVFCVPQTFLTSRSNRLESQNNFFSLYHNVLPGPVLPERG